ncbi:MAG: cadherin domain-containing protein [Litorimonas sp.]
MTRSFFTDKRAALNGYKARLSGVSLTALAMLGVARTVSAAEAMVETPPDGFKLASELKDFQSAKTLTDGSVEIVLSTGETVTIAAKDISMIGGEIFIAESAAQLAGLSFGSGVLTTTNLLLGAAALTGGGVAVSSSGEGNDAPVLSIPATVTVSENQTSAFTASASDQNGDVLTYSLSGADSGLFSINPSTGVITFNDAPDFEAPADGNSDNVYTVTVAVSDGAESVSQTVNITVTDVNEAPAITAVDPVSVAENQTAVATVDASDVDGDSLTFVLSGEDAALFAVDAATGAVTFVDAPDFETPGDANGDNVYEVTVTVSDGDLSTSQDLVITVTDVNEAPVITSGSSVSAAENQAAAFTATASDVDGDTLVYTLTGADAALFAIDAATGVVTFIDAPDFEVPADADGDNVYDVTVTASDGELSASQDVSVTVTDVNEAPVVTSGPSFTAAENQAAAFTATASDVDGDTLVYTLTGADAALFAIDAATGVVTFIDAPDFEAPADADGDNVYDVTVTASDGELSSAQDVSVTVTDVDDTAPDAPVILSVGLINQFVPNNDGSGGAFQFLPAITGTAEAGSTVEIFDGSISLGTTIAQSDGSFLFATALTSVSGDLLSATATDAAGNVSDAGVLDSLYGFNPSGYFAENDAPTIVAAEVAAESGLVVFDSEGVLINPRVSNAGDINNDGIDDFVVTSFGDDTNGEDAGQAAIIFGSETGFGDVVDGQVVIDIASLQAEDGFIVFGENSQDFLQTVEAVGDFNGDGVDDLLLGASGSDINGVGSGAAYVIFGGELDFGEVDLAGRQVLNLSDLASEDGLVFTNGGLSGGSFGFPIAAPGDINGDGLGDIVFGDTGLNGAFVVYGTSDSLGVIGADGREIVNVASLTEEQGFQVTADPLTSDFVGFDVSSAGDINGDGLADFALSAPVFENDFGQSVQGAGFIVFGSETTPGEADGSNVSTLDLSTLSAADGLRIIGTDPIVFSDGGRVAPIGDFNGDGFDDLLIQSSNFFTADSDVTYIVFGGEDGFGEDDGAGGLVLDVSSLTAETGITIVESSGGRNRLSFDGAGDFNNDGFDDVVFGGGSTSDGDGNSGSAFVLYGGSNVGLDIDNNQRFIDLTDLSVLEGFEITGQVDADSVGRIVSFAGDVNNDGIPDIILSTAGLVPGAPAATVIFGGFSPAGEDSETLALVQENTIAAFVATSLGEGTVFTLGGEDAALFEINQETGLVSFIDAPDFEAIFNEDRFAEILNDLDDPEDLEDFGFDLEILAVNGDLSAVQDVAITVTDVNEFAPEFITSDTLISSSGSYVLRATDADGTPVTLFQLSNGGFGFDDALSYEISGGVDADLFNLEVSGGDSGFAAVLSFLTTPAVDMPTDADGDGIYNVEVSVSDGEFVTTQTLNLSLVEGGAQPVFSGPVDFTIDELSGTLVGALTAVDPDGAEVGYFLSQIGANDSALFSIDFFTGELSFNETPSFALPMDTDFDNVYEVTVVAVDGSDATFQTVSVTVNDINFAPTLVTGFQTEFAENGIISFGRFSSIGNFFAQDLDFDDITGSITGGADADLFVFRENTFDFNNLQGFDFVSLQAFDFENPIDANGDNVYEIEVTFSDGVNETVELIEFTILDVFESPNAPVFTTPSTVQVNEGERFVISVNADDADGEMPTYSITGGENFFDFLINPTTGDISFGGRPRFNQPEDFFDNFYSIEVTADDGSNNLTTQILEIEVVDVDVAPTLNIPGNFSFNEGVNPFFGNITAFDNFENQALTLTLQGEDAAAFVLTNLFEDFGFASAGFEFAETPDFEIPADANGDNIYVVEVVVSDGVNAVIETITTTILDVFESANAPVFTSPSTIIANEGSPGTPILTITATDADGEAPTFSITGGPDGFRFDINSETGELSIGRQIIFDQFDPNDNFYTVEVTADDGSSNTTTQTITIEIQDTDVAPEFDFVPAQILVDENNEFSRVFRGRDAFDEQEVTLTIGGVDGALFQFSDLFSGIGFASGDLELVAPLDFENPLDADANNIYELEIILSDGVNIVTEMISVTVIDLDESPNAPIFTTPDMITVDEGQVSPFTVAADDADGDTVTFTVTGGADQNRLRVDDDGLLTFGNVGFDGPNFNDPRDANGDNVYEVEITASDGANNTVQLLLVTVQDANVAPIFSSRGTEATVDENISTDDIIFFVDAFDNFEPEDMVTLRLSGIDASAFTLVSQSFGNFADGQVSFIASPDFELPSDSNADNVYEFEIVASDGVNFTTETFMVTVEDIFESPNAPVFTTPDTVTVLERETAVLTVSATDADGDILTYSLTGGENRTDFRIDSLTGDLEFRQPANFEENGPISDNIYVVEVTADDSSGNQTVQTITVNLEDINFAPNFAIINNAGSFDLTVDENSSFSAILQGRDNFDRDNLTIIISGDDASLFSLDANPSNAGVIFADLILNTVLDFENPMDADGDNVYVLDVIVSDGVNDTVQQITITAQDVFESANAPVFVSPDTVSVDQGEGSVLFVSATDADGESPTYSLTGGADRFEFQINFTTGELTVPTFFGPLPPSFSGDNFYEVEVSADDGSGNVTSQLITVEIVDVDVPPTLNISGSNEVDVMENSQFSLYLFAEDLFEGQLVSITLGGADADAFVFNEEFFGITEGTLELASLLDFENPTDSDGDNVYVVDVIASDGVNETIETITVTVIDDSDETVKTGTSETAQDPAEVSISDLIDGLTNFIGEVGPLAILPPTLEVDDEETVKTVSDETAQNPAEMSVSDLIDGLTNFIGEADPKDNVLASFEVDTDDSINLNEASPDGLSISDLENSNLMPRLSINPDDGDDTISTQADAVALEMQFAADLLMLQESAAEVDG